MFYWIFLKKIQQLPWNPKEFPEDLKCADVVPIYKENDKKDKSNYRPISLLPTISKVYERWMQEQPDEYFNDLLSKYQCGFW